MNKKSVKERAKILQLLVEGNSLRATARIADCSLTTVMKLLVDAGTVCKAYQDKHLRNLPCKRIQVDEIWSFVYAKDKNIQYGMEDYAGSLWTFTSICQDTKIVPCWMVGFRNALTAQDFIADLAPRMAQRIQITSDGFREYEHAIEDVYGGDIDYGMLVKLYDENNGYYRGSYRKEKIGEPDKGVLTTAHVERQNLTMRMGMRRFTRKTNGFSKKVNNHEHAVALHFMYYNFVRIHQTLKVTPAMAAGVTERLWDMEDIAKLIP